MTIITEKITALREAFVNLGQDVSRLSDDELVTLALGRGAAPAPEWARKNAGDRIAEVREAYRRDGVDVSGLSDAELLNREVEQADAESRRHHNAYSMLLQDRTNEDRSVYAAARRSAQGDIVAIAGLWLESILRRHAGPVNEVVYRASQLPEDGKAPVQQTRDLRAAAERAQWMLRGMVGDSKTLEDAQRDPGVQVAEKLKAEIRRMRDALTEQGQRLHAEHGRRGTRDNGWRCECPGCELVRTVHDDREPVLHTVTDSRAIPAQTTTEG